MTQLREISTEELVSRSRNNAKIIDVRPVEAYNGWKLAGASRGGHIRGAKSLPAKWADYMDWIEIVRQKEIKPDDELIVYGNSLQDSRPVAELFVRAGYPNVSLYPHFPEEWAVNDGLPMEKLANYKHLVSAEWGNDLISGRTPAEYDNDNYVVVHAHYRNRDAYLSGHIPGAVDMDTRALEDTDTWNRRSPDELKKAFQEHGITADTTVVVYGKFMHPDNADQFPGSAAGHLGAIRTAFLMIYAGVKDVRVLNGGFQSWQDAGFPVSTADEAKQPVSDFGADIPANPQLAVDTPGAREMLSAPDADLVCVRSYPEYIGEVSGYNYIAAKGRIPGAVFADCGSDAYHMENYRNLDHTTREFHEIEAIWKAAGITPDKHLAFYCGTGWRGSEAWFNAWLMGWPQVAVYDGGWFEWSNDPNNPRETGSLS
ncbi:MAG: rhodanese-like domain-containing protein [Desulfobacterales bacterium]|nr:rhodanese-like domain-containing protein [Desulfobacterales bacterium]